MKNITVSVDDEVYRRARVKAAEMDTSVSKLVRKFLTDLSKEESPSERFERLKRLEAQTRKKIVGFSAANNLPRDALYDRKLR